MWDLIVSVPDHCLSFYFSCENLRQNHKFSGMFFSDNILKSTAKLTDVNAN